MVPNNDSKASTPPEPRLRSFEPYSDKPTLHRMKEKLKKEKKFKTEKQQNHGRCRHARRSKLSGCGNLPANAGINVISGLWQLHTKCIARCDSLALQRNPNTISVGFNTPGNIFWKNSEAKKWIYLNVKLAESVKANVNGKCTFLCLQKKYKGKKLLFSLDSPKDSLNDSTNQIGGHKMRSE